MSIEIPKQLRDDKFGFVKLQKGSKIPFEKGWQNKAYTYVEIQEWISDGGNYGVLGGHSDLVIIDADNPVIDDLVTKQLPDTFTVKTPGKGHHYYFICDGIGKKLILNQKGEDGVINHFGEIISNGAQVDTGTSYKVVNDTDIAMVTEQNIVTTLSDYIDSSEPAQIGSKEIFDIIVKKYGQPYYLNKDGVLTSINQSFWAGLNMAEHTQLYEPDEKRFYRYDEATGLYTDFSDDVIKQDISTRLLEVSRDNNMFALERKRTMSTLNNITAHLKGIAEKKHAFDHKNKDFIHLKNGVLKINSDRTVNLVHFSPDFCSRNQSPIAFDPEAKCERFLEELLYPAVSEDDALLIQKYAGLCILGENLIQRFMILGGCYVPLSDTRSVLS